MLMQLLGGMLKSRFSGMQLEKYRGLSLNIRAEYSWSVSEYSEYFKRVGYDSAPSLRPRGCAKQKGGLL